MKYKISIICVFLILVYCVSAVCAADLNETNSEDLKLKDDKIVEVADDDLNDNNQSDLKPIAEKVSNNPLQTADNTSSDEKVANGSSDVYNYDKDKSTHIGPRVLKEYNISYDTHSKYDGPGKFNTLFKCEDWLNGQLKNCPENLSIIKIINGFTPGDVESNGDNISNCTELEKLKTKYSFVEEKVIWGEGTYLAIDGSKDKFDQYFHNLNDNEKTDFIRYWAMKIYAYEMHYHYLLDCPDYYL